jgi:triacylglycerol lipase
MPIDAKLAILYGRFIQAAYTMYGNDPTKLTPPPSVDFPAGYQLTAWIQMQDFFIFGSTGPVFYGFIAHSTQGPNVPVLAIRGTDNDLKWWDDISSLGMQAFNVPNCGNVGMGWEKIYETLEVVEHSSGADGAVPHSLKAVGRFTAQVAEHLKRYAGADPAPGSIDVTGHSLGAALAILYAAENSLTHKLPAIRNLYTFASPMIGDQTFVDIFNGLKLNSQRVINEQDIVRILPPGLFYRHVDTEVAYDSRGKVQQSLTCCHALSSYLHLIDPTYPLSSACQPDTQVAALKP